ncbi:uncharacterized protein K452DRAFT_235848 [Aplosporella prunicola CBS 121167]|uniref:TATA-binding protein interacting (TIP20) domain-containing protein n=1 Tax=Aplosporella prunicola CBS 121167 TaxID=1176127 RepID=A0A6A6B260_9PEZI|nr:uncharacterized protein K452DRAFT_235848 [Aplosporella prunicola CBS 121167]KAF2137453.1 hypothetical protein K452DRAFT_235848 [Aplosporella prunicola CBS 121167]
MSAPTADVGRLCRKLTDNDPDLRYMALNDLHQLMVNGHPSFLTHDYSGASKILDGLIDTLNDTNGDVQNQAVRCLGPFVNKAPDTVLSATIERISTISTEKSVDSSVPALALRTIVVSLPKPVAGVPRTPAVANAYMSVSKTLIPRLIGSASGRTSQKGMLEEDIEKGTDSTAIDVLIEIARCFGIMLQEAELVALQNVVLQIIQSEKAGSVLKKKAVAAMSTLAVHFSDQTLSAVISRFIENMRQAHLTRVQRKLHITILGSMARATPKKFGPYLKTLAPFVLSALSESELKEEMEAWDGEEERDPETDEVHEAALVALESFLTSCSQEMRVFTEESIDAGIRFLKYDPNLATDEDDEDMDAEDDDDVDLEDEDFEEEAGFDDEDDGSWKVRRCASKVLNALISTRSHGDLLDDGTLYQRVAPALIPRFKDREESVRLEVLGTLAHLVQQSKPDVLSSARVNREASNLGLMGPPPSRKRRRVGSDASMFDLNTNASLYAGITAASLDSQPFSGPQESLAKLVPDIVRGIVPLLKSGTLPTKQATISLLKDVVITQGGGLTAYVDQIVEPVVEAAKATSNQTGGSGASSATATTLRIVALQLLQAIAETHSAELLQPYLSKIVPTLETASKERYSKVSSEALAATEGFVKDLTPPRTEAGSIENKAYLEQLFDILTNRISANEADVEARRRALHVLGLLLGRSSGSEAFISQSKRTEGLQLLSDRLKNEVTRLASVRAIEVAAGLSQNSAEFSSEWVRDVALELSAQLRKASRSLRGASLIALRTIVINPVTRSHLDGKTSNEIENMLITPIKSNDLHLMGPALIILATFVSNDPSSVVNQELVDALKGVVQANVSGTALDALLTLVKAIAEKNAGGPLMNSLLREVGVAGNPDLIGKVVGTLLVYSTSGIQVKVDDFVKELNTAADSKRQCLALAVLGEAGLRMGQSSPLEPQLFVTRFEGKDQVPLAAAVALGRAGTGNPKTYLPFIVSTMSQASAKQYLLLHSIREILQHRSADADLLPFAQDLWQQILKASQLEDNRAIGAECIGRLTIIDPKTFLPQLQEFLGNTDAGTRAMVISALRYTFADTDETYDDVLRPMVIPMLTTMLRDSDLDNQRLALTTMSSAVHNKPELVLPQLQELLPLVMDRTVIKPELIREVQMGPFKHKVDDGLEVRKGAYETLYTLLDTAVARLNIPDFSERIIAGIIDDHDVRTLCNLMLTKLVHLAPDETKLRLGSIADHFKTVIATKPKENAVKQEIEKIEKSARGVAKVSLDINKNLSVGGIETAGSEDPNVKAWQVYWDWVRREQAALLKTVEEESRAERDR